MSEPNLHIRFIFKSGSEFTIKCDSFTLSRNALGQIASYEVKGISENKPLYIDFSEVAAIVREVSNEVKVE